MYNIFEKLLRERGVSVADVCRATGIRQSTMSNWKKRNNKLSAKNAELIADYFGISVDELMGRIDRTVFVPRSEMEKIEKTIERLGENNYHLKGYYGLKETQEIAQEIFDDKDLHALFDAARGSRPEDLKMAKDFLLRLKETNPDG